MQQLKDDYTVRLETNKRTSLSQCHAEAVNSNTTISKQKVMHAHKYFFYFPQYAFKLLYIT